MVLARPALWPPWRPVLEASGHLQMLPRQHLQRLLGRRLAAAGKGNPRGLSCPRTPTKSRFTPGRLVPVFQVPWRASSVGPEIIREARGWCTRKLCTHKIDGCPIETTVKIDGIPITVSIFFGAGPTTNGQSPYQSPKPNMAEPRTSS